jgi:hypothetical protein
MVEHCSLQEGVLSLSGWAGDRSGPVREVVVDVDGVRVAAAPVNGPRPDVAGRFGSWIGTPGWSCRAALPAAASPSHALLTVGLIDWRGELHPFHASTVLGALLASSRLEVGVLQRELREAREALAIERARAASAEEALAARIAAMEASRFWKLRNAWFRVKRALGLTEER